MDLTIFEKVFALRDAARKADLVDHSLAPEDQRPKADGAGDSQLLAPPDESVAAKLVTQAVELQTQAYAPDTSQGTSTRAFVPDLLDAATMPFDTQDASAPSEAPAPAEASTMPGEAKAPAPLPPAELTTATEASESTPQPLSKPTPG